MTRRTLFQALAGLPVVGKLAEQLAEQPGAPWVDASGRTHYKWRWEVEEMDDFDVVNWTGRLPDTMAEEFPPGPAVTHYVGFDTGRSDVNVAAPHRSHQTIAEAMEAAGHGDRIVVAPGRNIPGLGWPPSKTPSKIPT